MEGDSSMEDESGSGSDSGSSSESSDENGLGWSPRLGLLLLWRTLLTSLLGRICL